MEGTTQNSDLPKKHKKRNKKLLKHLQDQIDFYFSDASLSKDRFLKQEISKNPDGYVEIQVIANFNRMKQMTEDINLVVKAMKNSSIVEVSSDKKLVRRIAALPEERNVDAQTIYVEKLPSYADHNWLTTVFSTFGKVDYVSIPRYKGTGDIKGFAFIEFQTEEDAKNALKAFNTRMEEEKEECNNEEQSEETEAPKDRKKRKRTASETETENDSQELKIERKRKRCVSESDVEQTQKLQEIRMSKSKRKRTTSESSADSDSAVLLQKYSTSLLNKVVEDEVQENVQTAGHEKKVHWQSQNKAAAKRKHSESEEDTGTHDPDLHNENKEKKAKARKRKKKEKKEKKDIRIPPMTAISKKQWLELKQQYKTLQKESLKKVKEALRSQAPEHPQQETTSKSIHRRTPSQKSPPDVQEQPQENKKSNVKELPFIPGVVLRLQCPPFEMSKKDVKDKLTKFAPVAYLDFKDGDSKGFVRFHTVENCEDVLKKWHDSDKESDMFVHKLSDEEEKEYWTKVNADRQERFNAKRPKQRGADKVVKKAETASSHILFD